MSNIVAASELIQYYVETEMQQIGYIDQLYFDDETWSIPYFRVSEQRGLIKKHYFIPFGLVERTDISSRRVFLKTKQEDLLLGLEKQPHFRLVHTTHDYSRFEIHTAERTFGKIEDSLLNRETWKIENLVINTHKYFGGKHILIRPDQVQKIVWNEKQIYVSLHDCDILAAPEFKHSDAGFQSTHLFG